MKTHSIVFLAMFAVATIIFGCKKNTPAPDYTAGIAGTYKFSGITVSYRNIYRIDTSDTTFSLNITAINNSTIAFTNPFYSFLGADTSGYETLNECATNSATKTTVFIDTNGNSHSGYMYDSLIYDYYNNNFIWHGYSGPATYDVFVSSQ